VTRTRHRLRPARLRSQPAPGVRPEVNVAEHTDAAAVLLDALNATPAVVVARSYGGEVACDLALR
jgi:pimeloyl-ACP methyl ester carboxylesterase